MAYKNLDRKMPAKGTKRIGWFGFLASLWVPTYWAASELGYHYQLESLIPGLPVYYPGQVISWAMTWGRFYPSIFIPALLVLAIGMAISILVIRNGGRSKR